jgi:hypothetical protein
MPQPFRESEGDHKIFQRQKTFFLHPEPYIGFFILALRATSVLTGMITEVIFLATITIPGMTAKVLAAAKYNITNDFVVRWQHMVAILL